VHSVQRLGYGLDDPGFLNPGRRTRIFCSPKRPDFPWGPPTVSFQWVSGSLPQVMRPERAVNHSPSFKAEVKTTAACS
jgi:hypothetical protein